MYVVQLPSDMDIANLCDVCFYVDNVVVLFCICFIYNYICPQPVAVINKLIVNASKWPKYSLFHVCKVCIV